jgi:hypothetical protein
VEEVREEGGAGTGRGTVLEVDRLAHDAHRGRGLPGHIGRELDHDGVLDVLVLLRVLVDGKARLTLGLGLAPTTAPSAAPSAAVAFSQESSLT